MKKIVPLMMAGVMALTTIPAVFAEDNSVDYSLGTTVTYQGIAEEEYTITVPAKLAPGDSGTVSLRGAWPSNKTITVTSDSTVTLVNSINSLDKKVLAVDFDGISLSGNDIDRVSANAPVRIEKMDGALFGKWNGTFYYNVDIAVANQNHVRFNQKYILASDVESDSFGVPEWVIFQEDGSALSSLNESPPGGYTYDNGRIYDRLGAFDIYVTTNGSVIEFYHEGAFVGTLVLENNTDNIGYKVLEYVDMGGLFTYSVSNGRVRIHISEVIYEEFGGKDTFWESFQAMDYSVSYIAAHGGVVNLNQITDIRLEPAQDLISIPMCGETIYVVGINGDSMVLGVAQNPLNPKYLKLNREYKLTWADEELTQNYYIPDSMTFKSDCTVETVLGGSTNTQKCYIFLDSLIIMADDYDVVVDDNGDTIYFIKGLFGDEIKIATYTLSGNNDNINLMYWGQIYGCVSDFGPNDVEGLQGTQLIFSSDGSMKVYKSADILNYDAGYCSYSWDYVTTPDGCLKIKDGGRTLVEYDADGEILREWKVEAFLKDVTMYHHKYISTDGQYNVTFTENMFLEIKNANGDLVYHQEYYLLDGGLYALENRYRTSKLIGFFNDYGYDFYWRTADGDIMFIAE